MLDERLVSRDYVLIIVLKEKHVSVSTGSTTTREEAKKAGGEFSWANEASAKKST
jgi:hypothetical protein